MKTPEATLRPLGGHPNDAVVGIQGDVEGRVAPVATTVRATPEGAKSVGNGGGVGGAALAVAVVAPMKVNVGQNVQEGTPTETFF